MHATSHRNPVSRRTSLLPALALALAGGMAAAPAFAQDADDRWAIVGGYAHQEPTGNGTIDGNEAEFDGSGAGTLGASWYLNENVAFEGWGAVTKFDHRVDTSAGKVGTISAQPWALSAQYHFRDGDEVVRPFVGLGYFQSNVSDEDQDTIGPYADNHVGFGTASGPMATLGMDVNVTENAFLRTDVRYLHGDSDIAVDGVPAGDAELNPVVIGLGVGARF